MRYIEVHHGEIKEPEESRKKKEDIDELSLPDLLLEHPWLEGFLCDDEETEDAAKKPSLTLKALEKGKLGDLTEEQRRLVWTTLEDKRRSWEAIYNATTGHFLTCMPGG